MFDNKSLKNLIIPLVIEQTLIMLVGIADSVMVSSVGEAAISGVALVDMINYLIIVILISLATGGAVIISQYLGSKNYGKSNKSANMLMVISGVISLFTAIVCILFHGVIIKILFGNVENNVEQAANTYFLITAFSFPFLGIYNSAAAIYRSMGKTNITMHIVIVENIINIFGNAIGIYVLNLGVAGAAFSTLLSRAAAAAIILKFVLNPQNVVYIKLKELFYLDKNIICKILKIAVPNGIENGCFALGKVLVTSIVALFGTSQIAANGVANSIDQIAIIVVNGINIAIITVVGQCMGAKEIVQAEKYTKKLMKISYISTGIIGFAVCIFLPAILYFYNLSKETAHLCFILIISHNILAFLFHPTSFNLANALRASGDVKITMYIGIGSMFVFRLGVAYIFGIVLGFGVIGVWIAMGTDWFARSAFFVIRYKSEKWKSISLI